MNVLSSRRIRHHPSTVHDPNKANPASNCSALPIDRRFPDSPPRESAYQRQTPQRSWGVVGSAGLLLSLVEREQPPIRLLEPRLLPLLLKLPEDGAVKSGGRRLAS